MLTTHRDGAQICGPSLSDLLDAIPAAVYATDVQGRVTMFNRAAAELAGREPQLGQDRWCITWRLYRPDGSVLPHDQCPMATALKERRSVRGVQVIAERPDGSRIPMMPFPTLVYDRSGEVVGAVNVLVDITDLKRAEEALVRRMEEQAALFRFTDRLYRADSVDEIYEAALDTILDVLRCSRASILLFDDTGIIRFVAWRGLSEAYRKAVEGHSPWNVDDHDPQPIVINDIESADLSESLKATVKAEGICALAFIPLTAGGKLIGKFMAYCDTSGFAEEEVRLALTIARQLGFSLERKRAEHELLQKEERLRQAKEWFQKVFEHSHDAIFVLDPERNAILEVNPAGISMFGYASREELLATPLSEFHPEDLPGFLEFVRSVREEGAGWTDEFACRGKDGRIVASEISASTIVVDGRRCLLAMVRDVGARKQAEQALRESEALLRATYENVQVGICEIDLSGNYQRVNETFCRITGYAREELIGRNFAEITHPDDLDANVEQIQRLRSGEIPSLSMDKRYLYKSGRTVWATLNATALRDQFGRPMAFLGAVQDITERKQAEEHRQLLVNELNHRVRNTLATVQAIAMQTLRGSSVEESVRRALQGRVLALAKAHTLLTAENWTGAGLRDVVSGSLQAFGLEEDRPGRISVSGQEVRLKPQVAVALIMAFHELATNAVKHGALSIDNGRVEVSWELQSSGKGERICLLWRERGGPPVTAPVRKGFGSHLIERALPRDVDGEVCLTYDPQGVLCRILIPSPGTSS